jgi:hypothetical protein
MSLNTIPTNSTPLLGIWCVREVSLTRRSSQDTDRHGACQNGLASEGSFGPVPFAFILPCNLEQLIWIVDQLGIEVVATASGKADFALKSVKHSLEVECFAKVAGLPEHYLIVLPSDE